MTGYKLADVAAAEDRIRSAVPGVVFERFDYRFGLRARLGTIGVVVFQPRRDDKPQIITPPDDAIAILKAKSAGES